ncbi:MAG: bifunctional folylpolyglutamate synthase/dihydrofolate synthase [Chitinivibrionales bacterium]|nr:bifunctional folylpolyglutamate synthase/dihydrofolate synthase [Chitinivibrionales bacterium]
MKNSAEIVRHLFSLNTRGIKFGLENISAALKVCGNPQNSFNSILVAGTNGKGSTCAYFDAMLRGLNFKVGLFTSPHIIDFEERFIINGKPIRTKQWVKIYEENVSVIDQYKLTFFEASTLIAVLLFKQEKIDWAVLEVGMGGRLDATNAVMPRLSVVTAIDIDHVQYLGRTIEQIAREKLGIMKRGLPFVMMRNPEKSVNDLAKSAARAVRPSQLRFVGETNTARLNFNKGVSFTYKKMPFVLNIPGRRQIGNALLAIEGTELLGFTDLRALARGIKNAFIPARFQTVLVNNKTIIFDVAHNPGAIRTLLESLADYYPGQKVCFIVGIMKDKDTGLIMNEISGYAEEIIVCQPKTERSEQADVLFEKIGPGFKGEKSVAASVQGAVKKALQSSLGIICVTGSFFTVGEAMTALKIKPFKQNPVGVPPLKPRRENACCI